MQDDEMVGCWVEEKRIGEGQDDYGLVVVEEEGFVAGSVRRGGLMYLISWRLGICFVYLTLA